MSKKIAHIGARPTFIGPKALGGVVVEIDRLEIVMSSAMAAELVRVVGDVLERQNVPVMFTQLDPLCPAQS